MKWVEKLSYVSNIVSPNAWTGSNGTEPLKPVDDKFYTFDKDNITKYELGDILDYREVGLKGYNYSQAWQFLYRSENTWGEPTATVTTIVLPDGFDASTGPANIVSYQAYEDSSFFNCGPGYTMVTGQSLLDGKPDSALQNILDRGYVLNFPDHEGKNSSFTAGPLEGKLTLDSLRALKKSENVTGVQTGPAVLWGYSGGSIATGWASEFYDWYAPELDIAAMFVGGFVVDLKATVELVNGGVESGFVPTGLMGLAAEYPELNATFTEQLKPEVKDKLQDALNQCMLADLAEFSKLDIFSWFKDGSAIFDQPALVDAFKNTTLGSHTPKAPLYVLNAIQDEIAPIDKVDSVVENYCNNGGKVHYYRASGGNHMMTDIKNRGKVLDTIDSIFAGNIWDKCEFEGLPIGEYGNNTVPRPLNTNSTSNSTNSTTSNSNSTTSNTTQTSTAGSGSASASASKSGSTSQAASNGAASLGASMLAIGLAAAALL